MSFSHEFSHEPEVARITRDGGLRRSARLRRGHICLRQRQAQQRLDRRLARRSSRRWRHWHEQVDQPPRMIG